jgi:hypothetical protein
MAGTGTPAAMKSAARRAASTFFFSTHAVPPGSTSIALVVGLSASSVDAGVTRSPPIDVIGVDEIPTASTLNLPGVAWNCGLLRPATRYPYSPVGHRIEDEQVHHRRCHGES